MATEKLDQLNNTTTVKVIDWLLRILMPIIFFLFGIVANTVISLVEDQATHDKKIAVLEKTVYTHKDAAEERAKTNKKLDDIQKMIIQIDKSMSEKLIERMDLLRKEMQIIAQQIQRNNP